MMAGVSSKLRQRLAKAARQVPAHSPRGRRTLRTIDLALRRLCREADSRLHASIDGVRFLLDTDDLIDFNLLYTGRHGALVVRFITARLVRQNQTLWDVGGNVGAVALHVASAVPTARVETFEPSPPVLARLEANLALNTALCNVRIHPWALSNSTGEADFFVSAFAYNSGIGGLSPSAKRQATPTRVPLKRGDDLIATGEAAPPDLIKLDVEGYELEVLQGLEGCLRARPVELVLEHEPVWLAERRQRRDDVARYLTGLGFNLYFLYEDASGGPVTRPLQAADLEWTCEIVARRESAQVGG